MPRGRILRSAGLSWSQEKRMSPARLERMPGVAVTTLLIAVGFGDFEMLLPRQSSAPSHACVVAIHAVLIAALVGAASGVRWLGPYRVVLTRAGTVPLARRVTSTTMLLSAGILVFETSRWTLAAE